MQTEALERRLIWHRRLNVVSLAVVVFVCGAWLGSAGARTPEVLRVRGLIVEDSLGRARVVIGAPLPVEGPLAAAGGDGMAVLSPEGQLRVAVGAPTPLPVVEGEVIQRMGGGNAGLVFFDEDGDERGGLGTFADGRASMCLDYANGVREAVCTFVFPDDQYAGITINGHPSHGYERANMLVGADGRAQVKISALGGHERAILYTDGNAPAQLLVYDSIADRFVDVMPQPGAEARRD